MMQGFLSDLPALAEQSNSRHPNYLRQSAAAPLDPIGTHYRENDLGDDQSEVALPMNEVAIDENDIIIVVLGPTGAGKSTFINLAVGRSETSVGHGLVSCTEEIRPVRYPHPDGERNFVLIDTPGFNNSHKSHIQVLQIIADWLKTTYKQKVMLSGLLYLHRISDNRMAGTPLSNLNMFKRLCGENNFKNIVLVTTMWDEVSEDVGLQREEELNMSFWEVMIRLGSTTRRFNLTKESAWDIINIIAVSLPEEPRALLIQDEMVNAGKPVYETSAGKVLRSSTDSLDITGFFKLSGRKFGGHMDDKDKVSWRYRLSRWLWPSSISSHSMNDSAPLRRAITALRLAQNAAKFINIHLLTEVIASSLNIAQALEVMDETHLVLLPLVENAALLIDVLFEHSRNAELISEVISDFANNLKRAEKDVQNMAQKPRDILQVVDTRALSLCVDSMRHTCDMLRLKLSHEIYPTLDSIDSSLTVLKAKLDYDRARFILAWKELEHCPAGDPNRCIDYLKEAIAPSFSIAHSITAMEANRPTLLPFVENAAVLIGVMTEHAQEVSSTSVTTAISDFAKNLKRVDEFVQNIARGNSKARGIFQVLDPHILSPCMDSMRHACKLLRPKLSHEIRPALDSIDINLTNLKTRLDYDSARFILAWKELEDYPNDDLHHCLDCLKEAIPPSFSIAHSIEAMEENHHMLLPLVTNAAALIGVITKHVQEALLSPEAKTVISNFAKHLKLVDDFVQNMTRRSSRPQGIFQVVDTRVLSSCVESMRHACDVLRPKLLHEIHPALDSIDISLTALKTMLDYDRTRFILAWRELKGRQPSNLDILKEAIVSSFSIAHVIEAMEENHHTLLPLVENAAVLIGMITNHVRNVSGVKTVISGFAKDLQSVDQYVQDMARGNSQPQGVFQVEYTYALSSCVNSMRRACDVLRPKLSQEIHPALDSIDVGLTALTMMFDYDCVRFILAWKKLEHCPADDLGHHIGCLKEAIDPSCNIAHVIEAMEENHHTLLPLMVNAEILIGVIIKYARNVWLTSEVKMVTNGFAKDLKRVDEFVQDMARKKSLPQGILQVVDTRILSSSVDSMRRACDVLRQPKVLPEIYRALDSIDVGLTALKTMLDYGRARFILAWEELEHYPAGDLDHCFDCLKEAIIPSFRIARAIETMKENRHILLPLGENAAVLIGVITKHARETWLTSEVKTAICGFAKDLKHVDKFVQNMTRRNSQARNILQVVDPRILSSCVDSMRYTCNMLRPKLFPEILPVVDSIDVGLTAVKTTLEHDCTRFLSTLAREGLELCPAGHIDRATFAYALASSFSVKFHESGDLTYLDDSITLRREVLALSPTALSHHELALCLSDRFDQLGVQANIDEAINLESSALRLLPSEHSDWVMLRRSLALYRQKKITKPTLQAVLEGTKKQVMDAVYDTLGSLPPRLLNTHTGAICNRDALISAFENSQQCEQLLLSAKTRPTALPDIYDTVSTYFKYVTLSHRWGKDEPLLRDIQDQSIYEMNPTDGRVKLETFCATAGSRGYLWAWSDTCCIDKSSTVELAKAIASMFSWYRRSALTIVYLADVSSDGNLSSSTWFTRGWTLQELLAPCTVLFYTRDWSLYKNLESSNHKKDTVVLSELEKATSIAPWSLTDFKPGMDDARSRLQWASGRRTTEPEDVAYSLFGIFNVFLPIIPGEPAENALGRFLAEIISQSGDISVLDWIGEASSFHSCFPAQITSYQTTPCSQCTVHDSELWRPMSGTQDAQIKLFKRLSTSDPPQFIGRRLRLSCIVHQVIAVQSQQGDPYAPQYVYTIEADGLIPFEITMSNELTRTDTSHTLLPYVLIRPWHSKLLRSFTRALGVAAPELVMMLGQPFSALLLEEQSGNEYTRIASSSLIIARPADASNILKSEVQTLNIA